jgi:3-deoxy-D-manno-octulosonic-acid transferase
METELWPNLVYYAQAAGVPLLLATPENNEEQLLSRSNRQNRQDKAATYFDA